MKTLLLPLLLLFLLLLLPSLVWGATVLPVSVGSKPIVNNTTIGKSVFSTTLGEDNDEVVIGDTASPNSFKPKITINKWNNEEHLSIRYYGMTNGTLSKDSQQISIGNADQDFYILPYDTDTLKFGLIFKTKPTTNTFTFQLEGWENFNFYYQAPLKNENPDGSTWQYNGKGGLDNRPVDVNGSYAVYHKSKKNNQYKTGKFGHIYCPRFIDANGNFVWGDLNIKDGIYTVTIPQDFLDKAIYPIKANDTFGRTSAGGSTTQTTNGYVQVSKVTSVSAGDITSITCFAQNANGSNFNPSLYADTLGVPVVRLAYVVQGAGSGTFNTTQATSVISFTILASTQYWLGVASSDTSMDINYDDGVAGDGRYQNDSIWPSPWAEQGNDPQLYSIYATYTPSGGATSYWGPWLDDSD